MVDSTWGCLDGKRIEIETDKHVRRIVLAKVYGRLSFADITKSLNQLYGQGAFLEQNIKHAYHAVLDIYLNTEEGRASYNFRHSLTDIFSEERGDSEVDILAKVKEGLLWAENPAAEAYGPISLWLYRERNGYVEYERCKTWALEQWEQGPLWELGN